MLKSQGQAVHAGHGVSMARAENLAPQLQRFP